MACTRPELAPPARMLAELNRAPTASAATACPASCHAERTAPARAGGASSGRVHAIRGGGELGFVIDAAGQVAERLRDWSLPRTDGELRGWLASWRGDGGDARRFRAAVRDRPGGEAAAWRYSVELLTPLRPRVRQLARALLVHPRHLPYEVAAGVSGFAPAPTMSA